MTRAGETTGAHARKLFGTDGIRGVANEYPMTPEVALKVGAAVLLASAFLYNWNVIKLLLHQPFKK